jgi:PEP-CTERM motif
MQNKWVSALLVIACVVLLSGIGFASILACPVGTWQDYLNLVPNACTIGDKTFSNFTYSYSPHDQFGISAAQLTTTPLNPGPPFNNPGFQWNAAWNVSYNNGVPSQDSFIDYTVTVNPGGPPITDVSLSMGGVSFFGTGSARVDETVCLGAMFPACSGGTIKLLSVYDNSAQGIKLFDEVTFGGVTEIDVQKDIELTSGTNGGASLSLVTNQFSETTTPEPSSILLFGSGALALAGVLRRKLKH